MPGRSLPDLGPRGEGWVVGQFALLGAIALAAAAGPAWSGDWRTVGGMAGLLLLLAGLALGARGLWDMRRSLTSLPRPNERAELLDGGAYRLVRHPMYGGLIMASVGWGLAKASPPALALAAVLAIYLYAKSRREERWLVERFEGYQAYRIRTRRFLPWVC
jgi:protein-S-isoprenylcysteine O-methyltransferase Ste14